MQQPISSIRNQLGRIQDKLREGREHLVLKLVIKAYRKMCEEQRYPLKRDEEWFSAVLENCIEDCCQEYSKETGHLWDVAREYYNDNEQIRMGRANPRRVPRIDILISYWKGIGERKQKFPFECKRIADNDTELIKLYVQEGLIDRYLTRKDYAAGQAWGGMIGYILQGLHDTIVFKLNQQVELQLCNSADYLVIAEPIADFEAIYKSQHQRPNHPDPLTITHLFLPFQARIDNDTQN